MAPARLLLPRRDPFDSPAATGQQTREAAGTEDSFGDTTWAVVAIVLGAFLMVTLIIFSVLYYMRWRQLARAAAGRTTSTRGGAGGGGGGGDHLHLWAEPPPAAAADDTQQLRHHRSRLRLDPAAAVVGSLASAAPRRLRKMTSEDQAEAHELERALMIRKSLASRESWGSNASHNTLVSHHHHNRSVSGGSSNSHHSSSSSHHSNRSQHQNNHGGGGSNTNHAGTSETDGPGRQASRYRSHDSLKSWEAGADGPPRNSRVLLPAASAESLRGHPALEATAATAAPRTPSVPSVPAAGLQRKLMSPLPPLPSAHTR